MGNKSSKTKAKKRSEEPAAAPAAPSATLSPTSMKAPGNRLTKASRRDSVRINKQAIAHRAKETGSIRIGLTAADIVAQREAAQSRNDANTVYVGSSGISESELEGGNGSAILKSISTIDDPSMWQPGGYDTHHNISSPNGTQRIVTAVKKPTANMSSGSDTESESDYSGEDLIEDWTQVADAELVNSNEDINEEEVQINCIPETRFCTFFHQFTLEDQRLLLDVMESREYTDGQDVVTQGETGNEFFIITEGEVVVLKRNHKTNEETDLTHLYRGQNFGEISMIYGGKRVASVRAVGKCKCLVLSKSVFEQQKHLRMFLITKKVPLLAELSQDDRIAIISKLQPRSFNEGDYVITQGDSVVDDAFYMITKGKCAVVDKGKTLTRLYEGHCFGEMALVLDRPRAASIVATTELKCMCLTKQDFHGALAGSEALTNILKKFVEERKQVRLQRRMSERIILNPRQKKLLRQKSLTNANGFIETKTCKAIGSFKKGTRKVNQYSISKQLGTGSFSTVYMATNTDTGQVVAVKVS